jgi:hypothetical protein
MREEGKREPIASPTGRTARHGVREREAGSQAPIWIRLFVRLRAILVSRVVTLLLVSVGLAAQVWLLWLAGELLELVLSVMELWAELARLHIETLL